MIHWLNWCIAPLTQLLSIIPDYIINKRNCTAYGREGAHCLNNRYFTFIVNHYQNAMNSFAIEKIDSTHSGTQTKRHKNNLSNPIWCIKIRFYDLNFKFHIWKWTFLHNDHVHEYIDITFIRCKWPHRCLYPVNPNNSARNWLHQLGLIIPTLKFPYVWEGFWNASTYRIVVVFLTINAVSQRQYMDANIMVEYSTLIR